MTEKEVTLQNNQNRRSPLRVSVMIAFAVGAFFPVSFVGSSGAAKADTPAWLSGPPDLEMREKLAEIYACMRDRAEEQTNVPLEPGGLAEQRLVNAINKAATDRETTGMGVYEAELPFFDVSGLDPVHLEFRITGEELEARMCL